MIPTVITVIAISSSSRPKPPSLLTSRRSTTAYSLTTAKVGLAIWTFADARPLHVRVARDRVVDAADAVEPRARLERQHRRGRRRLHVPRRAPRVGGLAPLDDVGARGRRRASRPRAGCRRRRPCRGWRRRASRWARGRSRTARPCRAWASARRCACRTRASAGRSQAGVDVAACPGRRPAAARSRGTRLPFRVMTDAHRDDRPVVAAARPVAIPEVDLRPGFAALACATQPRRRRPRCPQRRRRPRCGSGRLRGSSPCRCRLRTCRPRSPSARNMRRRVGELLGAGGQLQRARRARRVGRARRRSRRGRRR